MVVVVQELPAPRGQHAVDERDPFACPRCESSRLLASRGLILVGRVPVDAGAGGAWPDLPERARKECAERILHAWRVDSDDGALARALLGEMSAATLRLVALPTEGEWERRRRVYLTWLEVAEERGILRRDVEGRIVPELHQIGPARRGRGDDLAAWEHALADATATPEDWASRLGDPGVKSIYEILPGGKSRGESGGLSPLRAGDDAVAAIHATEGEDLGLRLRRAFFLRVFTGPVGLRVGMWLFDWATGEERRLLSGILRSLVSIARADALALAMGRGASLTIAPDLALAAHLFLRLRARGMRVQSPTAILAPLSQGATPFQWCLARAIEQFDMRVFGIRGVLQAYAEVVRQAPDSWQHSISPDTSTEDLAKMEWLDIAEGYAKGSHSRRVMAWFGRPPSMAR